MNRILITGAAGDIGGRLRRLLNGVYPTLRLSDIEPLGEAGPGEELDRTDLTDLAAVTAMCEGVDGIIHLGGQPNEADWETVRDRNITGTYNLFEAARRQGVKRVVFASSNHAVGFYRREQVIDSNVTPLPDSFYGVSKAFGESLGALYSRKHGLGVPLHPDRQRQRQADRQAPAQHLDQPARPRPARADRPRPPQCRLQDRLRRLEQRPQLVGQQRRLRLGYMPQDRADDYAEEVLAKEPEADPKDPSEIYQGGTFAR